MFSPSLLTPYYYYYYYCYYYYLYLLFNIIIIIISTDLLAQYDGSLGWGWMWQVWVAGGSGFWGVLATWV